MEIRLSEEVERALRDQTPVVALESTVLAHGLPRPLNLEIGRELERIVRNAGATPATVGVLRGEPRVGMSSAELEWIASAEGVLKLSTRDLPAAIAGGSDGATTVAATMWLARAAGVSVFATGGIGGVHRGDPRDVSADLTELARTPLVVVCAGAKAILDLPATREMLETLGILVIGWRTDRFPAFYSADAGASVDVRVESAEEVAAIWRSHRILGATSALLVCASPPAEAALAGAEVERALASALDAARTAGIRGKGVTPFLLGELARISQGRTLQANVALLRNNAEIAARIACANVDL